MLIVDRRASVQFSGVNSLILRVISVSDGATYDGWAWVAGYVIDPATGEATVRREIFVLRGGLRLAAPGPVLMRGLSDDGLPER
ncbi:hypothetical protein ACH45F_24190 [Catenuloplanes sp. NPDC020197]|uniref:hypothetical protein n=1 Tax=Catenuloplanes sp. NPDC020197 TaxID=3363958 RepID=UPI00378946F3